MNLSTFLISAMIVAMVAGIIRSMKKNKSCGGECGNCSASSLCHHAGGLYEAYKKGESA